MQISDATWRKSPHIIGMAPRSLYSANTEADAWNACIESARGCLHPKWVIHGRRIIGITKGFGPWCGDVVAIQIKHRTTHSERQRLYSDMLHLNWRDANDLVADLTNGKFGRTYFMKTPTTAGIALNWYDLWPVTGNPAAGSIANTAFTATRFDDTSTGSLNHRGNVSTDTKHILSKWAITTLNTIVLMGYDRVIAYDLNIFNANVNKVLTNTNTALRYNSGAPGLLPCIVVCAVTGATAANLTAFHYTNQAGTTLQAMPTATTVTFIPSAAVSSATLGARVIAPSTSGATVPWGFHLPLASGDTGCRLVNDFTTSALNTGSFTIVLMHPLYDLMMPVAAVPFEMDSVFQTSELEQIIDGACLAFMAFQTLTSGYNLQGSLKFGWGSH